MADKKDTTDSASNSSDMASQPTRDSNSEEKAVQEPAEGAAPLVTKDMNLVQEIIFVGLITMAQFLAQAGIGNTLSILHVIGEDLGVTNPGELSWFMASYSLTVGTFILPSGRWGDLFGYKKMYIIGLLWFALWTMVAGLSHYSGKVLFNFARALQGIGPAICLPNALAILGAGYNPGLRKTMVFSAFGAVAPVGSIAGASFAGLFAMARWDWTYYTHTLVLLATAILVFFFVPSGGKKEHISSFKECLSRLDLLGSFTGVLALVLISFAWNQAPVVGWQEPYVYVILILGFVFIGVFLYVEDKIVSYPLIPLAHLNLDVNIMLVAVGCGWASFGIYYFYTMQFFELLRGASPLLASAWFWTNGISGAIAAVVTGLTLGKIGPSRAMILALLAFLVGIILIGTAPVGQSYWFQTFWCMVILPWGMDISFPAATVIISDQFPEEIQGIGASLVNTVVNYSISMGLGFAGVVEVYTNSGGGTPELLLKGYRSAWYMGIGLAGLGTAVSTVFWLYTEFRDRKGGKSAGKEIEETRENGEKVG